MSVGKHTLLFETSFGCAASLSDDNRIRHAGATESILTLFNSEQKKWAGVIFRAKAKLFKVFHATLGGFYFSCKYGSLFVPKRPSPISRPLGPEIGLGGFLKVFVAERACNPTKNIQSAYMFSDKIRRYNLYRATQTTALIEKSSSCGFPHPRWSFLPMCVPPAGPRRRAQVGESK